MARALRTPDPEIFTADGEPMAVGQVVYGVDVNCRAGKVPTPEALLVVQVDLGARRQVRLRRQRGTEWTWTAQEYKGSCNTDDHYLYAVYRNAVEAATNAANAELENLTKKVAQETSDRHRCIRRHKSDLKECTAEIDKAKKAVGDFTATIRAMRRDSAPKLKFKKK